MHKNAFAVEAPPKTPLRELTALPRLPSWIWEGKEWGNGHQ